MSAVQVQVADGAALVTLNDPERRNALTRRVVDELVAAIDELENRCDVGALVITGAGQSFCAGGDIRDLAAASDGDTSGIRRVYDALLRVSACPLPTIAAVNGPAVGAGLNLALVCDVRIAATAARFDCRFLSLGLHPGGGNTWMLDRLLGAQAAAAMVLFGEAVDGKHAARIGLAWRCVSDAALLTTALELARRAACQPRDLLRTTKDTLKRVGALDRHAEAVELETERQHRSFLQPTAKARIRGMSQARATRQ